MKKLSISILIIFFSFAFSHAQSKKQHEWGCSFAINSIQAQVEIPIMTGPGIQLIDADGNILSGGVRVDKSFSYSIIPKLQLSNDILIRMEFGITKLNLTVNSDAKDIIYHVLSNRDVSIKLFRYAPGLQWTFFQTKKLESYCGFITSFIDYKSLNHNYYSEHRDASTDTLRYWGKGNETTPGGYALGVGAIAGFNLFLFKRISFGAEVSSIATYYRLGGQTTINETTQSLPNSAISTINTYTNSYQGYKISKIISSFNISIWF